MQTESFDKMSGEIEVDETFIGGKARNMHKSKREAKIQGRGTVGKTVVMGPSTGMELMNIALFRLR
jgi:hypothetical protein